MDEGIRSGSQCRPANSSGMGIIKPTDRPTRATMTKRNYVGTRINARLDDQGPAFLGQSKKNRVDAAERVVDLPPILNWYAKYFERKSGSVLARGEFKNGS